MECAKRNDMREAEWNARTEAEAEVWRNDMRERKRKRKCGGMECANGSGSGSVAECANGSGSGMTCANGSVAE